MYWRVRALSILLASSPARNARISGMLNERAHILLKTLVERHIREGQPVGSRALQQYSGLEVSSATIRNVMADL